MDRDRSFPGISACVVVFNEEKVIQQCLDSISTLVDEIIVIHDGICKDRTLDIARKYTEKIFTREHAGIMEAHLSFAFKQASRDWLLRIDADEYFEKGDVAKIKKLTEQSDVDGFRFNWEFWNGKKRIYFKGLNKLCLFRREKTSFVGIPQEDVTVAGPIQKVDIFLHHKPEYNNASWKTFLKKTKRFAPVHARYFFLDSVKVESFHTEDTMWRVQIEHIKKFIYVYMLWHPVKVLLVQLIKNGLWRSYYGVHMAIKHAFYYFYLYYCVVQIIREKNRVRAMNI